MEIGTIDETTSRIKAVTEFGKSRYSISVEVKDAMKPMMIFIKTIE